MLIGTAIRLIDGSLFFCYCKYNECKQKGENAPPADGGRPEGASDETKIFTFMQSDHSWTSNI